MTAEVAVLNKFGVALAADSAVTVDHFHKKKITTKVYNSANKLFTLSKFAPVGVMFYNTVSIGGIPWETVIKIYRSHLHNTKLDTIEEYCTHFFLWLNNNTVFSDAHTEAIISGNIIQTFVRLESRTKSKTEFLNNLDSSIGDLSKLPDVDGFDDRFIKDVCQKYRRTIDVAAGVCFKKSSYIAGQKRKLDEFVKLLLRKQQALPSYSGIVIAGFGEKEPLPKLREFIIDGVVSGKPRYWQINLYEVTESNQSEIVPLADAGVIKTLIEGISPDFETNVFEGAIQLLLAMPQQIIDPIIELDGAKKKLYAAAARKTLPLHFKNFRDNMIKYRRENYT
jgi:hypothetical protein